MWMCVCVREREKEKKVMKRQIHVEVIELKKKESGEHGRQKCNIKNYLKFDE
jgi:hypothetical protein